MTLKPTISPDLAALYNFRRERLAEHAKRMGTFPYEILPVATATGGLQLSHRPATPECELALKEIEGVEWINHLEVNKNNEITLYVTCLREEVPLDVAQRYKIAPSRPSLWAPDTAVANAYAVLAPLNDPASWVKPAGSAPGMSDADWDFAKAAKAQRAPAAPRAPREKGAPSKKDTARDLMLRPEGATLEEIHAATSCSNVGAAKALVSDVKRMGFTVVTEGDRYRAIPPAPTA